MVTPITDPTDRRIRTRWEHPRALVDWPVTIISATSSYQGKAANISRGGALVHLSQQLTVGEDVRLAFEVPDYQDVIVAKGEILRSFQLKRGDEQEFTHSAALQFTEISQENSKYFTGNIAPEWKEDYRDNGPISNHIVPQNVDKNTTVLPWVLMIFLLIPLCYLVYDSTQRKLHDSNLLTEVEENLFIIEKQITSLQNSLDILMPVERKLNDLQAEVSSIKNRKPNTASSEKISQQLTHQSIQIENIIQKIKHFDEGNSKITKNIEQEKEEEQQYYVVEKGDNLFQISSQNKITIQELREINGIGPEESIFPGQKIRIKYGSLSKKE